MPKIQSRQANIISNMSQTEEQNNPTKEPEATSATTDETVEEVRIIEGMKPLSAPLQNEKPLRYGNRRSKPGADAPAIASISSFSEEHEEEVIEMDDLVVRANAPEHLIDSRPAPSESRSRDDSDRPRRNDRSRGVRRPREDRKQRAPRREETSTTEELNASEATIAPEATDQPSERPERFGEVKSPENRGRTEGSSKEFRPSRDGRTAKKPSDRNDRSNNRKPRAAPKKKGFFAKLLAFFTGAKEEEEKKSDNRNSGGQRRRSGRGRHGPNNRERDGQQNREGGGKRRQRPRNRKPRPEGEEGRRSERGQQNREHRSHRPRRDGDNEKAREIGRQARRDAEGRASD